MFGQLSPSVSLSSLSLTQYQKFMVTITIRYSNF